MAGRNVALSNLRAVVIIIVVAFHSSLAYLVSSPSIAAFNAPPFKWQAFPIVDNQRSMLLDIFCAWQDVSLMSLMFLLSGLFVPASVQRKGSTAYAWSRILRIGLPFLFAAGVLAPASYYPAYRVLEDAPSFSSFWSEWRSLPFWPAGPQWFLWQLLFVNLTGAAVYAVWPNSIRTCARLAASVHPARLLAIIVLASVLTYVPLNLISSPWSWEAIGPFSLQISRSGHYMVYFLAGFVIGAHGLNRGLLASDGFLARNWAYWLAAAIAAFFVWAGFTSFTLPDWSSASLLARLGASFAFPIACACGVFFAIGLFSRLAATIRSWVLDFLSANAYSIYLFHYVFVVWLQYFLLSFDLPAITKAAIVFAVALMMSAATSNAIWRAATYLPVLGTSRMARSVSS
ncbi:MAG TPA: acyltransferase [Pseudolabrys sp.]|nr:acyltransferase [Pseudolabrys sp.]